MKDFELTIDSEKLIKGLRPSDRLPRNNGHLAECVGAIGRDGSLGTLEEITSLATTAITDGFPYPQIFVFTNMIIICGKTDIYEWVNNALVWKLTVLAGSTWSAVDFFDYVYMSNGTVAVIRRASDQVYELTTALPTARAICNFNGQVIMGAPGVVS